jgi:hypothetical protein
MKNFKEELKKYFDEFMEIISTDKGDWTVKGFIDIYKNIYTISVDTKVISKIIELMIFPVISKFATDNNLEMVLSAHQNHYPDITFKDKNTKEIIAIDLKSTYRVDKNTVNGMTLGAFTGYFRDRKSTKNITFPYKDYSEHYILGVIYSKAGSKYIDERKKFKLNDLNKILSVVKEFDFFIQEKWKIAIDRPGSGNTKNIGSTNKVKELKNGAALFTKFKNGKKLFNDYWINYKTNDMAAMEDLEAPLYHNIDTYLKLKKRK